MYKKLKPLLWVFFFVSVCLALGPVVGYVQLHSELGFAILLVISALAAIIVIATNWKRRRWNYKFELLRPGVVCSPLGFEVRKSKSRLEYVEGNHTISWHAYGESGSVGLFKLSEQEIKGWDEPFASEPMTSHKKREVFEAVVSALLYLQLVEEGKIRPRSSRRAM
jgi:hypothetical protein